MAKKQELGFAEARRRLDEILDEVESDTSDVDVLAERVREAAGLIRFCRDRLSEARLQVSQVVADLSALEQGAEGGAARTPEAGLGGEAGEGGNAGDRPGDGEAPGGDEDEDAGAPGGAPRRGGRLPF